MTTLYLTVDDAPSAGLPEKVRMLGESGVPALFFCEGRKLDEHLGHAVDAIEAGYHLGNHAYSHTTASELAVDAFREEVERTEALIEEAYAAAGVERPARLFRFPYGDSGGEQSDGMQEVLADGGFEPPAAAAGPSDDAPVVPAEMGDGWRAGDRDWAWTLHVEDWDLESAVELRHRLAEVSERLGTPGTELFLFHDEGTDAELFEALIAACRGHGAAFGDPLSLVE